MLIKDKSIRTIDFFKTLESKESQDKFIRSMQPCPACGHTFLHHVSPKVIIGGELKAPKDTRLGPCQHKIFGSIPPSAGFPAGVPSARVEELYTRKVAPVALSCISTCECRYLIDEFNDD